MAFDNLMNAVDPEEPCGPDLLEADDDEFINYYYDAEGRFPEKYYDLVREELFDAKTIDFNAEQKQIDALLKRSRDLRLLNISARFAALSGKLPKFCEAVIAMADLIDAFPDDVHPKVDADNTERRNAVEELNNFNHVLAPLQYATLLADKRIGDVSYRKYAVSAALVEPRSGETPGDASAMVAALASDENRKAVEALYENLSGTRGALGRMQATSKTLASNPFTPDFEKLQERLGELIALVEQARSDLAGSGEDAQDAGGEAGDVAGDMSAPAAGPTASQPTPSLSIPDMATAQSALRAVEAYFAANEPSAAALLLVTQARLLVGRPLVEALDTLLPGRSGGAVIDFGPETGFVIPMERMRTLTQETSSMMGAQPSEPAPPPPPPPPPEPELDEEGNPIPAPEGAAPPPPEPAPTPAPSAGTDMNVSNRVEAAGLIKGVEDFFRAREPASPIPVLLFKARGYLDKDFQALVRELLPVQQGGE